MASDPKRREKLVADILALTELQTDAMADARFGGWTREQEAAYDQRAENLKRLVHELETLYGVATDSME